MQHEILFLYANSRDNFAPSKIVSLRVLYSRDNALFYFLLLIHGKESIILWSNFQNGSSDGFTRFHVA